MIFVLSAIHPNKMATVLKNIYEVSVSLATLIIQHMGNKFACITCQGRPGGRGSGIPYTCF